MFGLPFVVAPLLPKIGKACTIQSRRI